MSLKRPTVTAPAARIAQTLAEAIVHHQQGRLARAERMYRDILKLDANHVDALHLSGVIAAQNRDHAAAIERIGRAVALAPQISGIRLNLANAYREAGRFEEALAAYDAALALDPANPDAWNNRGSALRSLGRLRLAMDSFARALSLNPAQVEALNNLGAMLCDFDRAGEGLHHLDRAVALAPGLPEAYNGRGLALAVLGRPEEALSSFGRALALRPDFADALANRGDVLAALGRADEAAADHRRALEINPILAADLLNRGVHLKQLARSPDAIRYFDSALALDPALPMGHTNRAMELSLIGRHADALIGFDQALALDPNDGYAHCFRISGALMGCDWPALDGALARMTAAVHTGQATYYPFVFMQMSPSAADQLACARLWMAEKHPAEPEPLWRGEAYGHDRVRVAYVSADFHAHATMLLAAGLFEHQDHHSFEWTAISIDVVPEDDTRRTLLTQFDHFVDAVEMTDRQVAELVREREIDILVDMKGFTAFTRLGIFAHRAAPLQISYLGYPGTVGAPYIDYIIADPQVIPAGNEGFFSEQVARLPGSYQVNDSKRQIAGHTPTRAEMGLPEQGFVFCCFNNNYKITPPVLDVWMRLLTKVEGSVLWLLNDNPTAMANLTREIERRGGEPARVIFADRLSPAVHIARQRQADLFLDTLPVNAHTTASDALWAGLPVLTCTGEAFVGRVAASLLAACGLPELITESLEDYEALALALATDPARLAALRAKLAANRDSCPLFDTERFTRHLEAAYLSMSERQRRGLDPQTFDVAVLP